LLPGVENRRKPGLETMIWAGSAGKESGLEKQENKLKRRMRQHRDWTNALKKSCILAEI
jgi:hypothetical protein